MIRPFYCGTQYIDWEASNCDRCEKAVSYDMIFKCEIQAALSAACIGSGEISEEIAKRAGINEKTKNMYLWKCSEVVWTEDWINEFKKSKKN